MFETVFEDLTPPEATATVNPEEEYEAEPEEPQEVIPTFTGEELEAARAEGFQAGKDEGLNASLDSIERQVSATLGNMEKEIARLLDGQKEANQDATHLALSTAVAIARKMLPEMASRNALAEIERVVADILPRIIDEPRVTARVHGDLESRVGSLLETLVAETGFTGQIIVNSDNGLNIGDCRLEWSCGGAERNTAALWRDIDDIITRNFDRELVTQAPTASENPQPAAISEPSTEPESPATTDD